MLFIFPTVIRGHFYRPFENKYTPFHMEGSSIILLELKYSIVVDMDGI